MISKKQFFEITARYGFDAKEFLVDSKFHDATSKTDAFVVSDDSVYKNVFHWKYNNGCPQASFIDWDNRKTTAYCDADDFEQVVAAYSLKRKERKQVKRIKNLQEDFDA